LRHPKYCFFYETAFNVRKLFVVCSLLSSNVIQSFLVTLMFATLWTDKGVDDDFNQQPFDFEGALAPAREVRVNFAHDTEAHQAWRGAGTPEDDLQVGRECVGECLW